MLLSCLVDLWLTEVCNKIIPTSFTLFPCVRVCVQVFSVSPLLYSLHLFYLIHFAISKWCSSISDKSATYNPSNIKN